MKKASNRQRPGGCHINADGAQQPFVIPSRISLNAEDLDASAAMTPEKAYEMGFRHIIDLAEMNRVASMVDIERLSTFALQLMDAWRRGANDATAMLEKQTATLQ